jgi:hypothetical protein
MIIMVKIPHGRLCDFEKKIVKKKENQPLYVYPTHY